MRTVVMPKMGDTMEEGKILSWHKHEGDRSRRASRWPRSRPRRSTSRRSRSLPARCARFWCLRARSVPVGAPIALVGTAGEALPAELSGAAAATTAADVWRAGERRTPAGEAAAGRAARRGAARDGGEPHATHATRARIATPAPAVPSAAPRRSATAPCPRCAGPPMAASPRALAEGGAHLHQPHRAAHRAGAPARHRAHPRHRPRRAHRARGCGGVPERAATAAAPVGGTAGHARDSAAACRRCPATRSRPCRSRRCAAPSPDVCSRACRPRRTSTSRCRSTRRGWASSAPPPTPMRRRSRNRIKISYNDLIVKAAARGAGAHARDQRLLRRRAAAAQEARPRGHRGGAGAGLDRASGARRRPPLGARDRARIAAAGGGGAHGAS